MPDTRPATTRKSERRPKVPSRSSTPVAIRIPNALLADARTYARAETVDGAEHECIVFVKSSESADIKNILLSGLNNEIDRRRRTNIERRNTQGLSEDVQDRIATDRTAADEPPYQIRGQAPPKAGRPSRQAMPPEPYEADGGQWQWSKSDHRWMRAIPVPGRKGRS